jgi:hypothetical protein
MGAAGQGTAETSSAPEEAKTARKTG